jgi:hypothetical protein
MEREVDLGLSLIYKYTMKALSIFVLVSVASFTFAQKESLRSTEFTVKGQVKKEIKITVADLMKIESKAIGDLAITNHLGEPKGTAKNLKGVLLKDLLSNVVFNSESPKTLSEFYLTLIATDNYKVVYSWNEIFNSPTGDNIWVVTEKAGVKLDAMDDSILVVCMTDFKTGRRHVKGLGQILVNRVN